METEEFVFSYDYNYYVYRKDSSGEHIVLLRMDEDEEDDYLHIWDEADVVSYSELLANSDSWKIMKEYKKGWAFPHNDVSELLDFCTLSFSLCYYDSSYKHIDIFTKWEDIMPWVMKLLSLSSNIYVEVDYLGVFHNKHRRVEFIDHKNRKQFYIDMVDELLSGREA